MLGRLGGTEMPSRSQVAPDDAANQMLKNPKLKTKTRRISSINKCFKLTMEPVSSE